MWSGSKEPRGIAPALATALALCLQILAGTASAQGLRRVAVQYEFRGPRVEAVGEFARVSIEGCRRARVVGEPALPFRTARVLLPPGTKVAGVDARLLDQATPLDTGRRVEFGRLALPLMEANDRRVAALRAADQPKAAVYNSDTPYPRRRAELIGVQRMCGYDIAIVRLFPVQYVPRANRLLFCPRMELVVEVAPHASAPGQLGLRPRAIDARRVAAAVDNPAAVEAYAPPAPPRLKALGSTYDYLLITSSALLSAFQPLVDLKTSDGLQVKAETMENVRATYPGVDDAEKLRNFIIYAYTNWNVRYVLLGGDKNVVPYRGTYGHVAGSAARALGDYTDNAIPCDLYFACLDGPWNNDGDSRWGEPNDGAGGGDVDLLAEVYVGRAPVETVAETQIFVNKAVAYEQGGHPNPQKALFLAESLGGGAQGGDGLDTLLSDFTSHTIQWLDDRVSAWGTSQCLAALNNSPHLVAHCGHANQSYVMRLSSSSLASLTNNGLFLVNSIGCYSGAFDYSDAIAEDFVKLNSHGAFAVVMNSRYGWYNPDEEWMFSGEFQRAFFHELLRQGNSRIGVAHQRAKEDLLDSVETFDGADGMVYRWCYFEITLFGDPHVRLRGAPTAGTLTVKSFDASPSVNTYFTGLPIAVAPAPDGVTEFTRTYAPGATVTLTAPAIHGGQSFSRWKLDGVDQGQGVAELSVTMNDDHTAVAVYQRQPLCIDMQVFQHGTSQLNPTGPAPRSFTILDIALPGDPQTTQIAITTDGSHWLQFVAGADSHVDVYATAAEPEWHTAAEWANLRLRGLTPNTTYSFQAKTRDGPGGEESGLSDVGSYSTNRDLDVDRSGTVTDTDLALVRDAVLSGMEIGREGKAWATDVNDTRTTTVLDLILIRNRILGIQ